MLALCTGQFFLAIFPIHFIIYKSYRVGVELSFAADVSAQLF
jgi:hypothetical protein